MVTTSGRDAPRAITKSDDMKITEGTDFWDVDRYTRLWSQAETVVAFSLLGEFLEFTNKWLEGRLIASFNALL